MRSKRSARSAVALGMIALCSPKAFAETSLEDAVYQMVVSGKWYPAAEEVNNQWSWYVDPYSIRRLSDGTYYINVSRRNLAGQYEAPDSWYMNIPSTFTAQIDCISNKFKYAGWTHNGIFRKRKQPHNPFYKIDDGTVMHHIKYYVCGDREKNYMPIVNFKHKGVDYRFNTEYNKYYTNINSKNEKYFRDPINKKMFFVDCSVRKIHEIDEDFVVTQTILYEDSDVSDPVVRRICDGSHPDISSVESDFEIKNSVDNNRDTLNIQQAKNKCIDLGYIKNTEKFGRCVLTISK
jgi:hypothetical protein